MQIQGALAQTVGTIMIKNNPNCHKKQQAIVLYQPNGLLRLEYFSKFIGLSKKIIDKSFAMS